MKQYFAIILYLMASPVLAGGDYVLGKITSFSGDGGSYEFHFVQTDRRAELITGCIEFNVSVKYQRVPWYSWLPFIHTGHPTKQETKASAAYLQVAHESNQSVLFGYMGYGLVPVGKHCTFKSRGLSLVKEEGKQFVLSYHDQT